MAVDDPFDTSDMETARHHLQRLLTDWRDAGGPVDCLVRFIEGFVACKVSEMMTQREAYLALQMPPDPGPDPTKLEYDDWVARTRECPACHGQGCEAHETDDGRLVCGPHCERCEGAGRIPL